MSQRPGFLESFYRHPAVSAIGVFLVSFALYVATLPPGLLWGGGDFARFQTLAYTGNIEDNLDALAHPLWVILAHPFTLLPIRDPAWRANLAEAVFASLALVFVFFACRLLTRSTVASLLATATLAVSHTFWTYAVMPKVYSLNALLLAGCTYLLLLWRADAKDRYLYLFALLYGLSFLNHLLMSVVAAGFAFFVLAVLWSQRRDRPVWRPLLLTAVAFGIGLSPYVYLMLHFGSTEGTGGTVTSYFSGIVYTLTHLRALFTGIFWAVFLGDYQFPLTALAGVLGLVYLWRHDRVVAGCILLSLAGTFLFMLSAIDPQAASGGTYIWNLHYYLQAYVIYTFAIAAGFLVLWQTWCATSIYRKSAVVALALVLPVVLYAIAPVLVSPFMTDIPDFRPLPGRDNLRYVLTPWKQFETGPREYADGIVQALPPNSYLFADYGAYWVVKYLQVAEHVRPDITVVELTSANQPQTLLQYKNQPNVFLADVYRYYDLPGIEKYYTIVPDGPIYRLVLRPQAS